MSSDSNSPSTKNVLFGSVIQMPALYDHLIYDQNVPLEYQKSLDKYYLLHWTLADVLAHKRRKTLVYHQEVAYAIIYTQVTPEELATLPDTCKVAMSFRRVKGHPTGFVLPWILSF